jgi:hypothetical protein
VNGGKQRKGHQISAAAIACGAKMAAGLVAAMLIYATPARAQSKPASSPKASSRATGFASLPAAAQSAISNAIGRDQPDYDAQPTGKAGFRMLIPRGSFTADFARTGVAMRVGSAAGAEWALALKEYGRGDSMDALSPVAPLANANRVEYRRGELTEWYVNSPRGLEQGFTLTKPPARADGLAAQPLTIAMGLAGDLTASLDSAGTGLILKQRDGQAVLRYTGLAAQDAGGKPLRCWLELHGSELLVRIDDDGARYPIIVDPWVQAAKLINSTGAESDDFGHAVAISGTTVVVGAQNVKVGSNTFQGAVYVFDEPASGWAALTSTPTAVLTVSSGGANDQLGYSVAIRGNTIVAGAPGATVNGLEYEGDAYVFVEPEGGWATTSTPTAELIAPDGVASQNFGYTVGVNESGTTVVVGSIGPAYVYTAPTVGGLPSWSTSNNPQIVPAELTGGSSLVAISGNTIVVGGVSGSDGSYVFVEPESGWASTSSYTFELSPSAAGAGAVGPIAISGGTIAIAGGTGTAPAVFVFTEPTVDGVPAWTSEAEHSPAVLTPSNPICVDFFAASVGINEAADTIVVGAYGAGAVYNCTTIPYSSSQQGAAYIFTEPTISGVTAWATENEAAEETASDAANGDLLGYSVGVSEDTVVAGAPSKTVTHPFQGAAYVFTNGEPSISPATLAFGDVDLNATSTAQNVTVTNTSATATITLGALNIPAGSGFAFGPPPAVGTPCSSGSAMSPGDSCLISVDFTPSAIGPTSATLTIQSSDNNGAQFSEGVSLSGTGVELDVAIFSTGEGGFPFSNVPVGSTSIATPFTLTNEGPSPMAVSFITITTNNQPAAFSNQFFLSSASCARSPLPQANSPIFSVPSFTIAPGDICTFTLGLTPEVVGSVTGQISFVETASSSNICGGASLASCPPLSGGLLEEVIPLTGTGTGAPGISVSTSSLNFPNQPVGVPVAAAPINLVNIGNVPLYFAAVGIAPTSPNFADFSDTTTCLTQSPLLPFPASGDSCTITVTFTPSTTTGQESASLFLTDDAGNPTSIPLTGNGVAIDTLQDTETIAVNDFDTVTPLINVAAPVVFFSTNSLGFGAASGTQSITVSNIGTSATALTLSNAMIPSGSGFALGAIACSNGDTGFSISLPAGGACMIGVTYTAPSSGSANATLTFTDNAALSNLTSTPSGSSYTQTIALLGGGTTAAAPPAPATTVDVNDNETIAVTDTPQVQTVGCPVITITPSGALAATIGVAYSQQFSATGSTATPLTWSLSGAPTWLSISSAGLLSGTPTATGPYSFTVTATDKNNCAGIASVSLTVAPKPTATTTTITMTASSDNGNALPANTALIENPVTVSFKVLPSSGGATATGTVKVADGVSASDGCTATLTGGAGSCAMTISPTASTSTSLTATYTPDSTATGLGLMSSASTAFTETIAEIDGCGTLPMPQTATQGSTSTYTFSVCLAGNITAAATAVVTGCPPSAECSDTITPVNGAPGVYTLNITIVTGAGSRTLPLQNQWPGGKPWPYVFFGLGALMGILMALRFARQRTPRRRLAFGTGLLFALLLVISGISGCAHEGSGGANNGGTPPDSYTVVVSITAGNVSILVPLEITVTK